MQRYLDFYVGQGPKPPYLTLPTMQFDMHLFIRPSLPANADETPNLQFVPRAQAEFAFALQVGRTWPGEKNEESMLS